MAYLDKDAPHLLQVRLGSEPHFGRGGGRSGSIHACAFRDVCPMWACRGSWRVIQCTRSRGHSPLRINTGYTHRGGGCCVGTVAPLCHLPKFFRDKIVGLLSAHPMVQVSTGFDAPTPSYARLNARPATAGPEISEPKTTSSAPALGFLSALICDLGHHGWPT